MKTNENKIRDNVFMENELRKVLAAETARLIPVLTKFIGQKILKADNSLCKKVSDALHLEQGEKISPLKQGDFARVHWLHLDTTAYSLYLKAAVNFNGGSYDDKTYYCEYRDDSVYMGEIVNGALKSVYEPKITLVDADTELTTYNTAQTMLKQAGELTDMLMTIHRKELR